MFKLMHFLGTARICNTDWYSRECTLWSETLQPLRNDNLRRFSLLEQIWWPRTVWSDFSHSHSIDGKRKLRLYFIFNFLWLVFISEVQTVWRVCHRAHNIVRVTLKEIIDSLATSAEMEGWYFHFLIWNGILSDFFLSEMKRWYFIFLLWEETMFDNGLILCKKNFFYRFVSVLVPWAF